MATTIVGVGDPKAVKKYSAILASDVARDSYFNRKFMGDGEEAQTPLQTLRHLENDSGDTISYDLVMQLKMKPVQGDTTLRGKEEDLKFYSDSLSIDQLRTGVNGGGRMTRKRTIHDLRAIARVKQSDWWSRLFDETLFMYLSGARGVNTDFIEDTSFAGYAGNPFVAPDSLHLLYGGAATAKNNVANTDVAGLPLIDRAVARAKTMGGGTAGTPKIQPVKINGEDHFIAIFHAWQEYALRTNASTGQWLDIQKAAATAEGKNSPIFKGSLGMYNKVLLHDHNANILFSDYGAGANLNAARALFLGRQAGVVAFGSVGTGLRFDWNEEMEDRGNQVVITTSSIIGIKKTAFTIDGVSRDFGVIAMDTYVADPS